MSDTRILTHNGQGPTIERHDSRIGEANTRIVEPSSHMDARFEEIKDWCALSYTARKL